MALRKWLKEQDLFHSDLEKLLTEKGITDPEEDFKSLSEKDWQRIYNEARVMRAQDLKSQKAKVRWEATLKKLEKFWRTQSGIKSTSILDSSKAAKAQNNADNEQSKRYQDAPELVKFMKENEIFDVGLFETLLESGVTSEEDFGTKIASSAALDNIIRSVRVQRVNNPVKMRKRLDVKLIKFEKMVVARNDKLKKTSIKAGDDEKELKQWDADKEAEANEKEGKDIKVWMKKEGVWLKELYEQLIKNGVTSPFMVQCLEEEEFDEIKTVVTVERFSNIKDQVARSNAEKILVKFEKLWRKESGVQKTSITNNTYK